MGLPGGRLSCGCLFFLLPRSTSHSSTYEEGWQNGKDMVWRSLSWKFSCDGRKHQEQWCGLQQTPSFFSSFTKLQSKWLFITYFVPSTMQNLRYSGEQGGTIPGSRSLKAWSSKTRWQTSPSQGSCGSSQTERHRKASCSCAILAGTWRMKGFRAVKETGRVETQEGEKGKVEDRVPKREKRIYKELEGLCLCGLDKLHSIEKSHAKKKKKKILNILAILPPSSNFPKYFKTTYRGPQCT